MYYLLIAVFIGVIIGTFTNSLAIKMLFRPLKPWMIWNYQIPFTPGLIPKRKDEIAESLGHLVENYLFTAKGVKQFIEKSGLKEQLYEKLIKKLEKQSENNLTFGYLLSSYFSEDWQSEIKALGGEKIKKLLADENFKEKKLKDLLSEDTLFLLEEKLRNLTPIIIKELKAYLNSIEGKRWLGTLIRQSLEGKKMLGLLAGMFLDGNQLQEKVLVYFEQILEQPKTVDGINSLILKEWDKLNEKPLKVFITDYEENIISEINGIVEKGITNIANAPVNIMLNRLKDKNVYERLFNISIELVIKRIDSLFSYLSISIVVRDEVNQFSLKELEKIILEISGRELKMIMYFGGLIGGLIGFLQGMLYLFF